jgi:hypothetical protein
MKWFPQLRLIQAGYLFRKIFYCQQARFLNGQIEASASSPHGNCFARLSQFAWMLCLPINLPVEKPIDGSQFLTSHDIVDPALAVKPHGARSTTMAGRQMEMFLHKACWEN